MSKTLRLAVAALALGAISSPSFAADAPGATSAAAVPGGRHSLGPRQRSGYP